MDKIFTWALLNDNIYLVLFQFVDSESTKWPIKKMFSPMNLKKKF